MERQATIRRNNNLKNIYGRLFKLLRIFVLSFTLSLQSNKLNVLSCCSTPEFV